MRVLAAFLLLGGCAAGGGGHACLMPRQSEMLNVELYMGADIAGRAPVSAAEWDSFVTREIAPRFPDGFTVLAGYGQWLSPNTGVVGREATHVVRIWAPPAADLAGRVQAVATAYKARFRQEAVGVTVTAGCGRFSE